MEAIEAYDFEDEDDPGFRPHGLSDYTPLFRFLARPEVGGPLTVAQRRKAYERLAGTHGERCAICKDEPEPGKKLVVDHHHGSGHVRGLLCAKCNCGIGLLRDDPIQLRAAARYIERAKRQRR